MLLTPERKSKALDNKPFESYQNANIERMGETMFVGGEGEAYWPQEMFSRHEVHTREILTQTETCGLYMASAI